MGIQRFYRWLKTHKSMTLIQHYVRSPIEILCIDFNGVLHKAAQETYAYGDYSNIDRRKEIYAEYIADPDGMSVRYNNTLVFNIIKQLETIINKANPAKCIYIAIDGIAPESKMVQQRERRYRSAGSRRAQFDIGDPLLFDTSAISPGTELMFFIDSKLQEWCAVNKDRYSKIIYSSHLVIGEGEHKIFDYLRSTTDGHNVIIHGLDSDLIMLSLLSNKNIFLMREMFFRREITEYLSVNALKDLLDMLMGGGRGSHKDFVFILYLIGNDFVPHMPGLEDRNTCIDTMIYVYNEVGRSLHDSDDNIDWDAFADYISALSKHEKELLVGLSERNYKYPLKILDDNIQNGVLNYEDFRRLWYDNAFTTRGNKPFIFPDGFTIEDKISEMCANYCAMIAWMNKYYTHGILGSNYNQTYIFYHTPLLFDLAYFLDNNRDKKDLWVDDATDPSKTIPIMPFHQLLYILPPESYSLLPEVFHPLMARGSSISDYYPDKYEIELQGKCADYEGVVMLPVVNIKRVITACDEVLSVQTPEYIKYIFDRYSPTEDKVYTMNLRQQTQPIEISANRLQSKESQVRIFRH